MLDKHESSVLKFGDLNYDLMTDRDGLVGMVTRPQTGRSRLFGFLIFFLLQSVKGGSGAHLPPMQWVQGDISLGIKRPVREKLPLTESS